MSPLSTISTLNIVTRTSAAVVISAIFAVMGAGLLIFSGQLISTETSNRLVFEQRHSAALDVECIHPVDSFCMFDGLQGQMNPDSMIDIIFMPKALGENVFNSAGDHHLLYSLEAKRRLMRSNFIVLSPHCQVLLEAKRVGLPTIRPASGADAGDLTYNYAMTLISEVGVSPFVGFANADIIFFDDLIASLDVIYSGWMENKFRNLFITGVRMNIDVPDEYMPAERHIDDVSWKNFSTFVRHPSAGKLFLHNTADFFLYNRNTTINWSKLPPFLVGGRAFDNWIVGWANGKKEITTIDITDSTRAVHVNHGSAYKSHYSKASAFNGLVFDKHGLKGSCSVKDCNYRTVLNASEGLIELIPQKLQK